MAKSKTDIARQLSNNGSLSVSDVAKKLNEQLGTPISIGRTKAPLEGSGEPSKKVKQGKL